MRRAAPARALLAALLLAAATRALPAPALPAYAASTAPLAALQLAQGVLGGRTLRCVHIARDAQDSAADGHARVNAAAPEGAALLAALAAVRAVACARPAHTRVLCSPAF
jgi:hypothetical protein